MKVIPQVSFVHHLHNKHQLYIHVIIIADWYESSGGSTGGPWPPQIDWLTCIIQYLLTHAVLHLITEGASWPPQIDWSRTATV